MDSGTGEEVERRELVKGYEFKKDHYVLLSDEDFASVKVESSSVMNVEKFADAGSIDPMYYDASYFLAPDGQAGEDVYAVLREAIADTGRVALARVVISQRERTIALRPMASGLMAHTPSRDRSSAWLHPRTAPSVRAAHMNPPTWKTATRPGFGLCWMPRSRARASTKEEVAADRGNVIDLMAALKKSLGQTIQEPPARCPEESSSR